jgi:hypothetical protein
MTSEQLLVAGVSAIVVALVAWFLWRRAAKAQVAEWKVQESEVRDLERKLHLRERDFLEEKNRLEIKHADGLRTARLAAFDEGRELGKVESQREHITELTDQRSTFTQQLTSEREQAAAEARDKIRAEYELQTKLFNVKISPYVEVATIKGLFTNEEELSAGYQYQLLVNGIPAFQPHVIVERKERNSKVNEENVKALLLFAKDTAEAAIQMYLGANAQFARLGPEILKRVAK